MTPIKAFNLRVYGIYINEQKEVLLSDEKEFKMEFTKFPGGGLEFGEGPVDCIKREWKEETGQTIEVVKHFYTTDFFQASAFNPDYQLISIYYTVKPIDKITMPLNEWYMLEDKDKKVQQRLRFIPLKEFSEELFTFPIDKAVAIRLKGTDSL